MENKQAPLAQTAGGSKTSAAALERGKKRVSLLSLSIMALAVGVVTGFGAIVFRFMVGVIHNFAFHGELSAVYDANVFGPPSEWGPALILVPIIGGLIVVFLVKKFAPEARGHGVPEVIDAVYFRQGAIRPVVAVVKSLASALSIGTGASVGREGPIIQIGAALGSSLAQWTKLPAGQRIVLLSAGAGAGIAATFNTPLGAVIFAVELMMPEISVRTFLPVVVATGTATYVGRLFFGLQPAFVVPIAHAPELAPLHIFGFIGYAILGIACGLAAWSFIRGVHSAEELFERLPFNDYVKAILGMGTVGVMLYLFQSQAGHMFIAGTSYATIQAVLQGTMNALPLLALLFLAKLAATSISLGAGASGGVFAPSLFLGTALGGLFGGIAAIVLPEAGMNAAEGAMVGMASVNAASTGAALTAIVMVFEMTRDYNIIVPMIIAVAIAVGIRRMLIDENIYSIKLLSRGHHIPKDRHSNMFMVHPAKDVMHDISYVLDADKTLAEALPADFGEKRGPVLVAHDGHVLGVIENIDALLHRKITAPDSLVRSYTNRKFVLARSGNILDDVLRRMARREHTTALVVAKRSGVPRVEDVLGVISQHGVGDSLLAELRSISS
ncbi:chloride channel protein [Aestuariispira ectoiniformans]|uniref:chloride channel protein n=1 Tax=Aestuariispira ectoiniformans TaxID=2775080 RepID=UPI00223B898C|nr:chloride channel protein [Aestuariispira ectoiniformans]